MERHDSPQDLSAKDRASILSLLAAVRHPQKSTLVERMSILEMCRNWFVQICVLVVLLASALISGYKLISRVATNTEIALKVADMPERMEKQEKKMRHIRPLVRQHQWQVEQGYTNADLKKLNIKVPEFPEED